MRANYTIVQLQNSVKLHVIFPTATKNTNATTVTNGQILNQAIK